MSAVEKVDTTEAMTQILEGAGEAAERLGFPALGALLFRMAKQEPLLRIHIDAGLFDKADGLPEGGSLLIEDHDEHAEEHVIGFLATRHARYRLPAAEMAQLIPYDDEEL